MRTFKFYPEERHWWSFNDYGAVLDAVAAVREKVGAGLRALEFGPGSSTLALIEGGATHIDTCEDDPHWAGVYRERLVGEFPEIVKIHDYAWAPKITIPTLEGAARYQVALIDGPRQAQRRVATLNYALAHADVVIVPIDACPALDRRLEQLAKRFTVDVRETGPLAGAFAIVTGAGLAGSGDEA